MRTNIQQYPETQNQKHIERTTEKKKQAEKVHLSASGSSWLGFIICDSSEFRDKTQIMKDTEIRKLGCVKALKGKCNFPTAFSLVKLISLHSKMLENDPYKHKHIIIIILLSRQVL